MLNVVVGDAGALFSQIQTDESGTYRLENIPPGRYYIIAGRLDAPTYFPGRLTPSGATSVVVTSGPPIDVPVFFLSDQSTDKEQEELFVLTSMARGLVTAAQQRTARVDVRVIGDAVRVPVASKDGRVLVTATRVLSPAVMAMLQTLTGLLPVVSKASNAPASRPGGAFLSLAEVERSLLMKYISELGLWKKEAHNVTRGTE